MPELTSSPQFYEVPIACAVCFQMLMFGAVYAADHSGRPLAWLADAPYEHPAFAAWSPEEYERAYRDVRVQVDGAEVLRAVLSCYLSPPQDLRLGTRGWSGDGLADRFGGRILTWSRLALHKDPSPAPLFTRRAPVMLTVLFPADRAEGREPLLASGGATGDPIECRYLGRNRMRLALDHADSGGPQGEAFDYDPDRPSKVQIWMGSFAARTAGDGAPGQAPPSRRVVVWVDGKPVLNDEEALAPLGQGRPVGG